ncbi:Mur ligase family protein [Parvularcula dongshanensis]|uniref:UDP-N-acetylmuramoylalanine--D-glutamate ligase n=1 Tax=Parvularcula dongshanensis TaxID=1173995 RepID=A0A840I2H3_9PROT|nr:UDP-N-acetylmuramoylalanine--D-glutamate ligase [Parvularcula dongshanensis]
MSVTHVLLHGLGVEGQAAKRYFESHTALPVRLFDVKAEGSETIEEAISLLGPDTLYLRSPGVPPEDALHRAALDAGATVTTPTGYWLANLAPTGTVTVTGTKGKSSTTALLSALLTAGGVSSAPYGNIGRPVLDRALPGETAPVVELSSYMMHDLQAPEEGRRWRHVVTNLYKEHTDWHGGEAAYREAKLRPYRWTPPCPGVAPSAVIEAAGLPGTTVPTEAVVPLDDGRLRIGGEAFEPSAYGDAFASPGLQQAVRIAAAAALPALGPSGVLAALLTVLPSWEGLPSRQARVPSRDGRLWIDDALATVPEATRQALVRFRDRPVRLILGGKDRGQDYRALADEMAAFDVRVFGFGEVGPKIASLGWPVFGSMEEAVAAARADCPSGGVVLFSPAAPSGAPHASYAERAALFARLASEA